MDNGGGALNGRPRLRMVVWLLVKVGGAGLACRLYARSVCDIKVPLQLHFRLMALYK